MSENMNRRRKSKRHEKSFIRDLRYEIMIAILFLLGVFLLVEDLEIKGLIYNGVVSLIQTINHWMIQLLSGVVWTISEFEVSDIVGSILVMLAFVLLITRIREKFLIRYSELSVCPECGDKLHLIHRTMSQKIVSKIFRLKIRRYSCKQCDFTGLRVRHLRPK